MTYLADYGIGPARGTRFRMPFPGHRTMAEVAKGAALARRGKTRHEVQAAGGLCGP